MKKLRGTNWKFLKRIFQILSMVIQQVQRYWARMRSLKQGLVEQLKKRKCRFRNHKTSEVEQLRR
jgi:hypothetical protein